MKTLLFTVLLCTLIPATAQITVDLEISEGGSPLGTLTLEVDHVNAPMATANFIGLATGKLAWIDSTTGLVQFNKPYYDGIKFHRVISGFVSQMGSQRGDGTDGPGYNFPDEPDLGNLAHDSAYVLSMANSGPNTNGSQVFITAAATPQLDPKHVVFGKVAAASESLADTINAVSTDDNDRPLVDVVIESATVNMNGVVFDPCAQGLPLVSAPKVTSLPGPSSTDLYFLQPPGSVAAFASCNDLASWTQIATRYADATEPPLDSMPLYGGSGGGRHFYAPSLVTYDGNAHYPANFENRTLIATTNADPANPITFTLNSDASGGTWTYASSSGSFSVLLLAADGFGGRMVLFASGLVVSGSSLQYLDFQRLGFDAASPTLLSGRQKGIGAPNSFYFQLGIGLQDLTGTFTLTR